MPDTTGNSTAPAVRLRERRRRRGRDAEAPRLPEPAGSFVAGATHQIDVGRSLRRLREGHDLSIRALAEKSGLAVNTLSLIENGKTSPSVSTLQALAVALAVPITAFFETDAPRLQVVHLKAGARPQVAFAHGTLEDVGAGLAERTVEPFVVTLEPGAGSGPYPIVHTGHEFVFCLEGGIAYSVDEQTYLLDPGDSLLFAAHLPHRWQNVRSTPSRAILVLCPGEAGDRPVERHFAAE